ncbi:MAG: HepT-like ribonuclease domain-containing protein [Chloroflexota bacterium]|nr:HepT-like ribonuclease domain-containing protein [Chloroflexota bacterium]
MKPKRIRNYLIDLRNVLNDVESFEVHNVDVLKDDIKTQYATIRAYEVIGEIVKRRPQEFKDAHLEVDWQKLTKFRDFIAHNDDLIIVGNLWNAVEDAPRLKASVEKRLHDFEAADAPPTTPQP